MPNLIVYYEMSGFTTVEIEEGADDVEIEAAVERASKDISRHKLDYLNGSFYINHWELE